MGCPSAIAPPLTLTLLSSTPSSLLTATEGAAKASFSSKRSTSPTSQPALCSAALTACTGATPITSGSSPDTAEDTTVASGDTPREAASEAEQSTTAAAPSFRPDALPAVTLPLPGCRGGKNHEIIRFHCRYFS